jgi:hypothetical protein
MERWPGPLPVEICSHCEIEAAASDFEGGEYGHHPPHFPLEHGCATSIHTEVAQKPRD